MACPFDDFCIQTPTQKGAETAAETDWLGGGCLETARRTVRVPRGQRPRPGPEGAVTGQQDVTAEPLTPPTSQ